VHEYEVTEGSNYAFTVSSFETSYDWIFYGDSSSCDFTIKMGWALTCEDSPYVCSDDLAACTAPCPQCCKSYLDQPSCQACVKDEC